MAQRALRPYPPGRVRVNTLAYPSEITASPALSWAHRNRLQQNLEGDESGNIGPEGGVTYRVRLTRTDSGTVLDESGVVDGTSYAPPVQIFGRFTLRAELWAVRGELASEQRHDFTVLLSNPAPVVLQAITAMVPGAASGT